jgi:hypothetical protein
LNDEIFERPVSEGPVLALQGSRYLLFAPMVVIRSEGARILSGHKRCHKLALGPADPANQRKLPSARLSE